MGLQILTRIESKTTDFIVWCLQAQNPKDQYLLLRALNEVITSVQSQGMPPSYQSEVR